MAVPRKALRTSVKIGNSEIRLIRADHASSAANKRKGASHEAGKKVVFVPGGISPSEHFPHLDELKERFRREVQALNTRK